MQPIIQESVCYSINIPSLPLP